MNVGAAIGVFAALLREEGLPLSFPGGGPRVGQAVDANLLGRAIVWAGLDPAAANHTFNVANGDVFVWAGVWPAIADALGMAISHPESRSIDHYCRARSRMWDDIRARHALLSPGLEAFVGTSLQYADYIMRVGLPEPGPPSIVSTIRIQAAGFRDVVDTETMFRSTLLALQATRLLPSAVRM
jgi:hypothetical protein